MSEILKVLNRKNVELKSERIDLSLVTQIRGKCKSKHSLNGTVLLRF